MIPPRSLAECVPIQRQASGLAGVMPQSSVTKGVWHVALDLHRGFKVYPYFYSLAPAATYGSSATQVPVSDREVRNVSNYTCRLWKHIYMEPPGLPKDGLLICYVSSSSTYWFVVAIGGIYYWSSVRVTAHGISSFTDLQWWEEPIVLNCMEVVQL